MPRNTALALTVILLLSLTMTHHIRADNPATRPVTVQQVNYKGWDGAWMLSNGTVEVVVVPAIGGRIMHYGFVGGRNELWENPTFAGKSDPPGTDWQNFGGDKIWPWPQDEWPQRMGRGWPPVYAMDLLPFDAELVNGTTLRLTSQPVPEYGVRVRRDVTLAPQGTRLTVASDFIPVEGHEPIVASAWEVTQLPFQDLMFVRLLPGKTPETGIGLLIKDAPWRSFTEVAPRVVRVVAPGTVAGKLGADGDLLAGLRGDTLLIQTLLPAQGKYEANERLQVYSVADSEPNPNIEFEFTAPRTPEADGTTRPLVTQWELEKVPADQRTPEAIAARLGQR